MTAQSLVCATCAAAVPYGRLSCPACGELLASVSGRRGVAAGAVTTSATPAVLYDPDLAPSRAVLDGEIEHGRPWDDAASPPPRDAGESAADALDDADAADANDDGAAADPAAPAGSAAPADAGVVTADDPDPANEPDPVPAEHPRPAPAAAAAGPWPEAPGAYLPPAFSPPAPIPAMPAGPAAPARAWGGHDASSALGDPPEAPGRAGVERPRMAEFVGWLSVAGAALAAVGFLLPWSSSVIGATGVGYFDRWGLAGPFHPLVVVGLLAVLALSLVRVTVPTRIGVGLPALGLGALLVGLVWPYAIGPLGAGAGVVIVGIGAVALIIAGILAIVTDRHAPADSAV